MLEVRSSIQQPLTENSVNLWSQNGLFRERSSLVSFLCPAGGFSSLKYWLPSILAPGPHGILTHSKLLLPLPSHSIPKICSIFVTLRWWVRQQTACRQGRGRECGWNAVSCASRNAKLKPEREQVTPNMNSFNVLCMCNRVTLLCSTSPLLTGHLILLKTTFPVSPHLSTMFCFAPEPLHSSF